MSYKKGDTVYCNFPSWEGPVEFIEYTIYNGVSHIKVRHPKHGVGLIENKNISKKNNEEKYWIVDTDSRCHGSFFSIDQAIAWMNEHEKEYLAELEPETDLYITQLVCQLDRKTVITVS